MDTFPHDPRTIRARLRRYERALREEQARFDGIRDGAGTRYMLGPLYLLLGDTAGALRSFACNWLRVFRSLEALAVVMRQANRGIRERCG